MIGVRPEQGMFNARMFCAFTCIRCIFRFYAGCVPDFTTCSCVLQKGPIIQALLFKIKRIINNKKLLYIHAHISVLHIGLTVETVATV